MKIYTVVGARPNFIKLDPELKQTIIHTGQHYDTEMSDVFFRELKLPKPTYNLGRTSSDFGGMTDDLRGIFKKDKPDLVLVYGDTISSLAGALAASFEKIKLVHIESGLRSYTTMPEEINRVVIDRLATVRVCPNAIAELNLLKEGIKDNVYVIGDPEFDALGRCLPIPRSKDYRQYNLLTIHRDFNADNPEKLKSILDAATFSRKKFIFPIHPRTALNISKFKLKMGRNIKKIKPQPFKKMLGLIANADKVLTDSGGVQREAFWLNTPVIILRDETEWTEITARGSGILVGSDYKKILDAIFNFKGFMNPPPEFGVNQKIREVIYKHV